jgi:ribosomal protein S7
VYAALPAADVGRTQDVRVSSYSGVSNVLWWLADHGYDATDHELAEEILAAAKQAGRALSDQEIVERINSSARQAARSAPPAVRA